MHNLFFFSETTPDDTQKEASPVEEDTTGSTEPDPNTPPSPTNAGSVTPGGLNPDTAEASDAASTDPEGQSTPGSEQPSHEGDAFQ